MTALAQHFVTVGVGKFYRVVIEDLSRIDTDANLASTHPLRLDGESIHQPVSNIEVVNVLLDNMVSAKPIEVVPVFHLVLEFGFTFGTRSRPHATAIPVDP